ncbi:sensor histidine kinase [Kordiimonas gwangyangensis]|uniref:sensor histidine kinase n=2 Tax=Kordiimonas gwangyangensis TaxID=288022 RepID=UPI000369E211|nr:ATP-binding protein [Kordiimonas gwangyangensis]
MSKPYIISMPIIPVPPHATCGEVYERFHTDPDLVAIPVVTGDKPVGLLKRIDFLIRLADRYGRPLYENRPVAQIMDANPLIIENNVALDQLNRALVGENKDSLQAGFIVVEDGVYVGIGTAYTLLKVNMERAERRMKDLEVARMEAEAATRARTQFLANMSHELRTPLNAIIGFAEFIMSEDVRGRDIRDHRGYISDIRDSGKHLLSMINSILDLSKLEASAFVLREDYESPREITGQVVRMMEGMAKARGIVIEHKSGGHHFDLHADIQVVKQVLINLISNAIKFSPNGSVVRVYDRLNRDGCIEFQIADSGPGMTPDVMKRVMQPFVQADTGLARKHDGTGLGLPLVKAFMDAHGGAFTLTSTVGVGTTAQVVFPAGRAIEHQTALYATI